MCILRPEIECHQLKSLSFLADDGRALRAKVIDACMVDILIFLECTHRHTSKLRTSSRAANIRLCCSHRNIAEICDVKATFFSIFCVQPSTKGCTIPESARGVFSGVSSIANTTGACQLLQ